MSWENVCRAKIIGRGRAVERAPAVTQGFKRKNTNMERYKISEKKENHRRFSWEGQSG